MAWASTAPPKARDSLRAALDSPPAELPRHCGLVATALHFLAGYGLYLNVSTDRFISRLLDNLNPAPPQPLHGPFHPSRFEAAARYARCGTIAKQLLAQDVPPSRWGEAELWSNLLPEHLPLSSQACARAARAALQQADSDWQQECLIFHVPTAPAPPEDWRDVAWEDPWLPSGDPRSGHLLTPFPGFTAPPDFALFGDGGFSAAYGATFCSQARGFGRTGHYWEDSSWASQRLLGRLPARYGWESCTVHTAELHSLLCALRFRVPGRWHLLVFDRSSLFQVMRSALRGTLHQLLHSSCCTLVLLLRRVLKQLEQAWDGTCPLPAWKLHQQHCPERWHTFAPVRGKLKCHSRVAFEDIGLVGLDIKSHQAGTPVPFPNLVQGNVVQDQGCDEPAGGAWVPGICRQWVLGPGGGRGGGLGGAKGNVHQRLWWWGLGFL